MFDVNPDKGLTLIEIADEVSVEDVKAATGCPFEVCFWVCRSAMLVYDRLLLKHVHWRYKIH